MKIQMLRLISVVLVLAMPAEVIPVNLPGVWFQRARAAEAPADFGFAGLSQPEPLPTTIDISAQDLPQTISMDENVRELIGTAALVETEDQNISLAYESVEATEATEVEDETSNEEDDEEIEAPYTFDINNQEKVNLNTGDLVYEATDYVLPGKNGLDLVIGRRYNSRYASQYGD